MEIEDNLTLHHQELIELSKKVSQEETEVETLFESLEIVQTQLDEINEEYDRKIEAL